MNKAYFISVALLAASCTSDNHDGAKKFTGTFVRSSKDSLVLFEDTLSIAKAGDADANLYAITRRMGKARKGDDGQWLPMEFTQQDWSARFKPDDKSLEVENNGEHYVTKGDDVITNGQVSYQRIK